MKRLEKRLTSMFLSAKKEAKDFRDAKGITTMDILKELLEDSDSLLYEYLAECSYDDVIEFELNAAMEELAHKENIPYEVVYYLKKENGEEVEILLTQELFDYIKKAEKLAGENEEIIPDDLTAAIIKEPTKAITKFLRASNASMAELKDLFNSTYEIPKDEIPEKMTAYVSLLEGDDKVLGRDKELDEIWTILLKKTKRNLILVGEPGIGKTSIVRKLVSQIEDGTAPEDFKGFTVYILDVTAVVSGTKYRGEAEEKFKEIISFIKTRKKAILFIDEAHLIIGAGSAENTNTDLANSLKPILAGDNSRVIAATTTKEYEKYFSKDPAFKRRFEKIIVKEPRFSEVYRMITAKVNSLSEYHKVKITHQMVDFIALYASCFNSETKNPDRTLDLIDKSMVTAKRRGKSVVDRKCVLANFKVNMEAFNIMPFEEKQATAYHEVGHYLAYRFLPYPKANNQVIVVSIYPAENYIGITVTERKKNVYIAADYQSYIERIATCLAGGIAEKLVSSKKNDGVSSDSKEATRLANNLITSAGFYNHFFYQLQELKTEEGTNNQILQVKKILKEAEEVARKLIEDHKEELEAIAEELLKKRVLSNTELEAIVSRVQKETFQKNMEVEA